MNESLKAYMEKIGCTIDELGRQLNASVKIKLPQAKVVWRQKEENALLKKMSWYKTTNVFTIQDVYAFRVIVENENDVYIALSAIEDIARGHLKHDYIANPLRRNEDDQVSVRMLIFVARQNGVVYEIQITTEAFNVVNESLHDAYHRRKYGPELL